MIPLADELTPVKAYLEAVFGAARKVYTDRAPDAATGNYVVLSSTIGVASSESLAGSIDRRSPVLFVTSVASADLNTGVTESQLGDSVRWALRKASDALAGWRPTVGRATFAIEHVVSDRPIRDRDVPGLLVMAATDQYLYQYQP